MCTDAYLRSVAFILILNTLLYGVDCEECIYGPDGLCLEPCPPDTFSYSPGCTEMVMSQRTCRSPVAKPIGQYCDYSRCDCKGDLVWDETAKKCVEFNKCSIQKCTAKKGRRL